jgi:hypothetical protein
MAVRKVETFPPVTMGHIRGHGCRDLLVYCGSGHECRLAARRNAGPLVVPADGLHSMRDDWRRRAARLVAARQQAARLGRVVLRFVLW